MKLQNQEINYQFTGIPTKLYYLLDNNCRSTLFTLIQLSSCYADDSGYFFRTNSDLRKNTNLSQNLVIATIDTLFINRIIDVVSVGKAKGKKSNKFKINTERFIDFEKYSMDDLDNPENKIYTVEYKEKSYKPSYLSNSLVVTKVSQSDNKDNELEDNSDNLPKVTTNKRKKVITKSIDNSNNLPKVTTI